VIVRDAKFSSAECEAISGVSQELQRNWRRRGYLGLKAGGRAEYTPHDLAALRVMKLLSELMVGPALSARAAATAAPHIVWHALVNSPTAWQISGDRRRAAVLRKRLELVGHQHFDEMARLTGEQFRFCVVLADATALLTNDPGQLFMSGGYEASQLLDLENIGGRLSAKAKHPLMLVDASDDPEIHHKRKGPPKSGSQGALP